MAEREGAGLRARAASRNAIGSAKAYGRRAARLAPDQHRRGEVLDRRADRLEKGNLVAGPAALRAAAERRQIRDDVGRAMIDAVARPSATSPPSTQAASVSTKIRARLQRLVVGLAHPHVERADEVEMLSGPQPCAGDQRRGRKRRAGDDVGFARPRARVLAGARPADPWRASASATRRAPSGRWFQTVTRL